MSSDDDVDDGVDEGATVGVADGTVVNPNASASLIVVAVDGVPNDEKSSLSSFFSCVDVVVGVTNENSSSLDGFGVAKLDNDDAGDALTNANESTIVDVGVGVDGNGESNAKFEDVANRGCCCCCCVDDDESTIPNCC